MDARPGGPGTQKKCIWHNRFHHKEPGAKPGKNGADCTFDHKNLTPTAEYQEENKKFLERYPNWKNGASTSQSRGGSNQSRGRGRSNDSNGKKKPNRFPSTKPDRIVGPCGYIVRGNSCQRM